MSPKLKAPIGCAIVGFGGMAKLHANYIKETGTMAVVAACDTEKDRLRIAREHCGDIPTYSSLPAMLRNKDVDLCVLVLPHNLHSKVAVQCLNAGKHVVVEKPMAITVAECTAMINAARKARKCLTVFHNRRWDGDFMTIRETVEKGLIGDVFHVELTMGGFRPHSKTWRGVKKVCGGAFYDWGVHVVDWCLNTIRSPIRSVSGQFQKRVWMESTNEDHCEAYVRFRNGASALITLSNIMAASKPRWYILGTEGAIVDRSEGQIEVYKRVDSHIAEFKIKYQETLWTQYYPLLAKHLLDGVALPVKPESARRNIGVIEAAERASKTGKEQTVPYE